MRFKAKENDIFKKANTWADDYYTLAVAAKTRYQYLALGALAIIALQAIAITMLLPLKRDIPLAINHYPDGYVTVTPVQSIKAPVNKSEIESELVRYIINRESYSATSYPEQFALVNLLSSDAIARDYMNQQEATSNNAFVKTLGNEGTRIVHIESINFLDRADWVDKNHPEQVHRNLAQIDYTVTTHLGGSDHPTAYSALVSWDYRGTPDNPEERWKNWDGFVVTDYQNNQRSI